jgi:hypothetical protein
MSHWREIPSVEIDKKFAKDLHTYEEGEALLAQKKYLLAKAKFDASGCLFQNRF